MDSAVLWAVWGRERLVDCAEPVDSSRPMGLMGVVIEIGGFVEGCECGIACMMSVELCGSDGSETSVCWSIRSPSGGVCC